MGVRRRTAPTSQPASSGESKSRIGRTACLQTRCERRDEGNEAEAAMLWPRFRERGWSLAVPGTAFCFYLCVVAGMAYEERPAA